MTLTLSQLRRYAVARSLFKPTSLLRALDTLGFVQADPIRAPARAQDLTLRHRVSGYRAGELQQRYRQLPLEEAFFVNYGFVPRPVHAVLQRREPRTLWSPQQQALAQDVLAYVAEHGVVHPRKVAADLAQGKVRTWFGGSAHASTQLLDGMHYRGLLRVAGREGGTRLYALAPPPPPDQPALETQLEELVRLIITLYAPLPLASFNQLVGYLGQGAAPWKAACRAAAQRVLAQLPQARLDGVNWCWPAGEDPASRRWQVQPRLRLLTPFDPVVWDRRRFELLWGWRYRFEAYLPAPQRQLGYYAMPLLWADQVIGWGNLSLQAGQLQAQLYYVAGHPPADAGYAAALEAELAALGHFLHL